MPEKIGDNILPDSVAAKRSQLRERMRSFRKPVRRFREQNIPGPDVVGMTERQFRDLRDKIVSREGVVSRIKERRSSSSKSSNDKGKSSNDKESNDNQQTANQIT